MVLLAPSLQCKPFLRDHVCHINYMIGKAFYNPFVIIWCGSPNVGARCSLPYRVQALLPDSVTVTPTPKLPTQFRFNCSLSPSRISSTLPASTLPPFPYPSLIPGPKHSQMHSFDFSVLNESSLSKVLLTPLSAEFWTSLVTQTVKNLRAMQETQD